MTQEQGKLLNSTIQQHYIKKNQETLECDRFIYRALLIAKYLDENEQNHQCKERIIRNCIASSMPSINKAITSVSDVEKYNFVSIPSFYNLNLYVKILEHLLNFYLNVEVILLNKIKTALVECIEITHKKVNELILITGNPKALDMAMLSELFVKYNGDLDKFKKYIEGHLKCVNDEDVDAQEIYDDLVNDILGIQQETSKTKITKIKSLNEKANDFFDDWEKSQKVSDAQDFINNTSSIITGITELGGLIAGATGNEEVEEAFNCAGVIIGATLSVGISLIGCAAGPLGLIGVAASLIGGITSITSYFINRNKKTPEEMIIDQIAQLGDMIQHNFKNVFKYLNHIEQTIIENFVDIKNDLAHIDKNISVIKKSLDNMFDILLDEDYFNNRNEMLTYHENFNNDMPYEMQIKGFYNFINCSTIKPMLKSKHLADGIPECIQGIKENGIDEYIPFLAEYADTYLSPINRLKEYISPIYWAEGSLSLVEFILRTPEFCVLNKQQQTFNEIIQLGKNVNNLTEELFDNNILEKIIMKYISCLDDYMPELSVTQIKGVDTASIAEYINEIKTAVNKSLELPVFNEIDKYATLIKAYFKLIHSDDYRNNSELLHYVNCLWDIADFKNYLCSISFDTYNWMSVIPDEYNHLVATYGEEYLEEILLFINNKYGLWKRVQNIKDELRRVCRQLICYSKLNKKRINYTLVSNIINYLERFKNEFFGDLPLERNAVYAEKEAIDYIFFDFGNILNYNSVGDFANKNLAIIGNAKFCKEKSALEPWKIFDGSWHTVSNNTKVSKFSIEFNLSKIDKPIYLRLCSRFINMNNTDYLNRKVSITLSNQEGEYDIEKEYRPETFVSNMSDCISLFDGSTIVSPLRNRFFREDVWRISADKLSKNNRLIISSNEPYMVHNIEIATDIMPTYNKKVYALYARELNSYLAIEDLEKDEHRLNTQKDLNDKCHFIMRRMLFTNYVQLYSPYVKDIIVPTVEDFMCWFNKFNFRPWEEVLNNSEIARNKWLYVNQKEDNTLALIAPKFSQNTLCISYGYVCEQLFKNAAKPDSLLFYAGNINHSKPLWLELKQVKL